MRSVRRSIHRISVAFAVCWARWLLASSELWSTLTTMYGVSFAMSG